MEWTSLKSLKTCVALIPDKGSRCDRWKLDREVELVKSNDQIIKKAALNVVNGRQKFVEQLIFRLAKELNQ